MMTDPKENSSEIREHILEAARSRFGAYGYNKTTMAEIAKDCDMSASNIYRFFENKLEIGATLSSACLNDRVTNMQLEIARHELSCEQRFRNLVLRMLRDNFEGMSENPKINELVVAVCNDKKDVIKQHSFNKRQVVEQLLLEANEKGEFSCSDVRRAAHAILTATVLFDMPLLLSAYTLSEVEQKADELCDLLLDGLRAKSAKNS